MRLTPLGPLGVLLLSVTLGGCSTGILRNPFSTMNSRPTTSETPETPAPSPRRVAASPATNGLPGPYGLFLEEHRDGRIYAFDDLQNYQRFLACGQPTYPLIRVWAGPHSETLEFARTEQYRDRDSGFPGIDLYEGKANAETPFYGEIHRDGRYYVFTTWSQMNAFRSNSRVERAYTEERAGPQGESVIYSLATGDENPPQTAMGYFRRIHNAEFAAAAQKSVATSSPQPAAGQKKGRTSKTTSPQGHSAKSSSKSPGKSPAKKSTTGK